VIYTLFERRTEDRAPKRLARAARRAEKAQARAAHAARVAEELAEGTGR